MQPIDSQTLEMLRCPLTKSKLKPATSDVVDWINERIRTENLNDNSGAMVNSRIDFALVNESETLALPIRAGVISLSASRAFSLKDFPSE